MGANWVWTLRTKGGRQFWRVAASEGVLPSILSLAADENKHLGLEYRVHASSFSLRWGSDQDGQSAKQAVERASAQTASASAIPQRMKKTSDAAASAGASDAKSRQHAFRLNQHLERHFLRHAKWLALQNGLRRCLGHTTTAYDHEASGHMCDACMDAMRRKRRE